MKILIVVSKKSTIRLSFFLLLSKVSTDVKQSIYLNLLFNFFEYSNRTVENIMIKKNSLQE